MVILTLTCCTVVPWNRWCTTVWPDVPIREDSKASNNILFNSCTSCCCNSYNKEWNKSHSYYIHLIPIPSVSLPFHQSHSHSNSHNQSHSYSINLTPIPVTPASFSFYQSHPYSNSLIPIPTVTLLISFPLIHPPHSRYISVSFSFHHILTSLLVHPKLFINPLIPTLFWLRRRIRENRICNWSGIERTWPGNK